MSLVGCSRRTLLARGGVALASSAVVAACGGTAQKAQNPVAVEFTQPVEIAFWHPQSGSNGKALEDMVARFNSVNDRKITVKATFQGSYDQLFEKNQVALNAGTPADLSVAYEQHVAEYMRGHGCIDLEPYTTDSALGYSKEALADIFPTYLEGLRFPQYGNQLLSFPFTKSLAVMYVNEEVLQRSNVSAMPRTWQEFAGAVQQTSRTDSTLVVDPNLGAITGDAARTRTYGWGNYPSASTINAWAFSRGGTMLTADNKQVRFSESPYLEAFQLTEDMFKRGYAYNPPRQPGSDFDFASNRMAFIHQSSTSRPFVRRVLKDNGREAMPWRIVSIPQKDPARPATVQYGANVAIFRTTPHKQAASWAFIRWFTDREQDVQWSITSSYMPIRRSSAEHPTLKAYWEKEDPQGKQAFDLSRTARPEPNVRGTQEIRGIIQRALQDVMEGKLASRAALEQATREANLILQQSAG